jgi:two-component sensor histidine kinase
MMDELLSNIVKFAYGAEQGVIDIELSYVTGN